LTDRRLARRVEQADTYTFFNCLTDDQLLPIIDALLPPHRERVFTPTLTLSMFMAQALSDDGSCQKAVDDLLAKRVCEQLPPCSVSTGAYCRARRRLPKAMITELVTATGALAKERVRAPWLWQGRSVKLVDGTTISMADTAENQADYPQQSMQAPGLGFPIARLVALMCLASGAVLNAAMGPYQGKGTGEGALLRTLLESFETGDVLLADRYFCSYFIIALLLRQGVDVLFEQHAGRKTDFRRGKRLGVRDHLIEWKRPTRPDWMTPEEYAEIPETLTLREVKVGRKVLVTTLHCKRQAPPQELGRLFASRWHVELDLRNIKSTLGMEVLRCKTPEMVVKEMWVYLLAYNLVRLLMLEAAAFVGVLPRQISFKHTVQLWLAWSLRSLLTLATNLNERLTLYELIASRIVGKRPGRVEPRAIKRRPKPYRLLNRTRCKARAQIRRTGHPKKLK